MAHQAALLGFSRWLPRARPPDNHLFAVQIRYMLGDAGESFVVGFGPKSPLRVTHGAASCAGNYTVPPAASRARTVCCMLCLSCVLLCEGLHGLQQRAPVLKLTLVPHVAGQLCERRQDPVHAWLRRRPLNGLKQRMAGSVSKGGHGCAGFARMRGGSHGKT